MEKLRQRSDVASTAKKHNKKDPLKPVENEKSANSNTIRIISNKVLEPRVIITENFNNIVKDKRTKTTATDSLNDEVSDGNITPRRENRRVVNDENDGRVSPARSLTDPGRNIPSAAAMATQTSSRRKSESKSLIPFNCITCGYFSFILQ